MAKSSGTSWYRVASGKLRSDLGRSDYRSGTGTTGRLRCPLASVACTAKTTLSFDTGTVACVTLPNACACSQSGAPVSLHNTRYPVARPPGDVSQTRVESFCSPFVNTRTFAGGAGTEASVAKVAAFTRTTFAM